MATLDELAERSGQKSAGSRRGLALTDILPARAGAAAEKHGKSAENPAPGLSKV